MRVIEAPRRPLLVVAGAGSGKTETMSMRVLWLLANHPDLTPASILGLTFTRKAAGELGDRLRERIRLLSREMPQLRERLDEDPVALTYNSFAERIVSEHGMRIGLDPDFSMLSEAGAIDLMTQIVEAWPTDLDDTLTPTGVVEQVLHLAGEIAEHGYTVGSAREALEEFGRELEQVGRGNSKSRDAIDVNRRRIALLDPIEVYQQRKRDMGVLDFSDQLVLATRIVREAPAVRESLREEFRAVLLDEFQDTSVIQMDLLSILLRGSRGDRGGRPESGHLWLERGLGLVAGVFPGSFPDGRARRRTDAHAVDRVAQRCVDSGRCEQGGSTPAGGTFLPGEQAAAEGTVSGPGPQGRGGFRNRRHCLHAGLRRGPGRDG